MRRVAEGQQEALAVLVRRHQERVRRLAGRFLGSPDEADDVCQETFLRIYHAAREYRPTAAFATWLYRVVANLCWDHRRRAARRPVALPPPDEHPAAEDRRTPAEQAELSDRVRKAVARLPDRQRLALVLHRDAGLSHREIAEATGWSESAVESCLVRAYRQLRADLSDLREA